jgi:disulfide oxidoreductase YuzD
VTRQEHLAWLFLITKGKYNPEQQGKEVNYTDIDGYKETSHSSQMINHLCRKAQSIYRRIIRDSDVILKVVWGVSDHKHIMNKIFSGRNRLKYTLFKWLMCYKFCRFLLC